jgi:myo-inositol-1(or 4)-monophosphatase
MTSQLPASDDEADLALLVEGAREAGAVLRRYFGNPVQTWSKGAAGPVTQADLEADALLRAALTAARPGYGWLSEETADTPDRLAAERLFIVDPLDGTRSFLAGIPQFCVSLAIADQGRARIGVVYNPITEKMFAARAGGGATLNGEPIEVSRQSVLAEARMLGAKGFYAHPKWPVPWPAFPVTSVHALAYRLALVAAGKHDGMVALGYKHDWDVAAGAVLVEEAGGVVTDPFNAAFRFNREVPRQNGAVAAGPALHPLLIERVRITPHPAALEADQASARAD